MSPLRHACFLSRLFLALERPFGPFCRSAPPRPRAKRSRQVGRLRALTVLVSVLLSPAGLLSGQELFGPVGQMPLTEQDLPQRPVLGLASHSPGDAAHPGEPVEQPTGEFIEQPAPDEAEPDLGEPIDLQAAPPPLEPLFKYRLRDSNLAWLVAEDDGLGIFSIEAIPSLPASQNTGIVAGAGFHFLNGPVRTDLPPRLFDFQIGLAHRKPRFETFGYDLQFCVGAFSDFEASARQGVRFPGHAVGCWRAAPAVDIVFGAESLDRDDISVLPVAGAILRPTDAWRLELVFPRPRVEYWYSDADCVYLSGELGGGTWAIERANRTGDVVTYSDLRMLVGIATRDEKGSLSAFEAGYVFSRELSYRSHDGDYSPHDALLLALTHRY